MAVVPFPDPQSNKAGSGLDDRVDPLESSPDLEPGAGKMSFLEHLDELRKRIARSLIALAGGVAVACIFITQTFDFIMRPLQQMLPGGGTLIYTEPTEAFMLYVKIAIISGLIIAAPFIMWQVWLFVAPALYSNEKRFAVPFVVLSSAGFVAGAAFSHYVAFPLMWRFFGTFSSDFVTFMPRLQPAFGLYVRLLLALGLVFQMPSIVFFLSKMGVITARWMIRQFKYAILVMFILAALITPSADMAGQTIVAVPMIGLYIISIAIAWIFGKRTPKTKT